MIKNFTNKPHLNLYMAEQLMRLKSSTGLMSFVTTVWDGVPIMVTWNTVASNIIQIWEEGVVDAEDIPWLANIIENFLKEEIKI